MSEKIDLKKIAAYESRIIRQIDELAQLGQLSPVKVEMRRDAQDRLALVRAVRAARGLMNSDDTNEEYSVAWSEFDAALAPFTDSQESQDSAEVRSDGG